MSIRRAIHRRSRVRAGLAHVKDAAIAREVARQSRPSSLPIEAQRLARPARHPFVQLQLAASKTAATARPRSAVNTRGRLDAAMPLTLRQPACADRTPIGRAMSFHATLSATRQLVMRDALTRAQSRAGMGAASIQAVPVRCAMPARSQPALRTRPPPVTGHDRETLQGRRSVRAAR